jgi:hypothetical protein
MLLNTVLTSVNINTLYIEFIPNFVSHWKTLFPEIDIIIVLISDHIPEKYMMYEKYIKLYSNKNDTISSAFQAMCIRNLYPCILHDYGNILITDIDMMPMNRKYYENPIKDIDEFKFVSYRDVLTHINEYPMCYNIANTKIWKKVFGIETLEELDSLLNIWYDESNYVIKNPMLTGINNFDQRILFKSLCEFNKKTGNLKVLNDKICNYHRLDRLKTLNNNHTYVRDLYVNGNIDDKLISDGKFSDYHALRPYSKNKKINDQIKNCLYNQNNEYDLIMIVIASRSSIYDEFMTTYWSPFINYIKKKEYRIKVILIFGNNIPIKDLKIPKENIFVSDNKDSLRPGILLKTIDAMEHVSKNYKYKHILRTNLSSFFILDNLIKTSKTLKDKNIYAGVIGEYPHKKSTMKFISGAAFWLSKDNVSFILNNKKNLENLPDDVAIAKLLTGKFKTQLGRYDLCNNENPENKKDLLENIINDNEYHIRIKNNNRQIDIELMKFFTNSLYKI